MVLVVLGAALLLGVDRVGNGQEERKDHKGQEDELVVENEHCVEERGKSNKTKRGWWRKVLVEWLSYSSCWKRAKGVEADERW